MPKPRGFSRFRTAKKPREMSLPLFHFIMVFIDKAAADMGTLRMTFSRRVTVVTTNK